MSELHNQLFYQIGEISDDGYFLFHTGDKKLTYLNNACAKLSGISLDEIKESPEHLLAIVHPEDRQHAKSCYEECLTDLSPKKYEIRLMVDETEKFVRFAIYPFSTANQIILCGTIEDVTVAKHNKIHIELINAHKNITLEVLSHDLKEPLGMMRLTASAMEKEAAGNKKMLDSINFIKEMCERNIKLVRSLVNHEFVKSSGVELKKERTDLVWELQDVIRFYKRSHLRELKDFRFSSSDEKIYLFLDSMKFLQVVNNLISNAIKFTANGGIIELKIQNQEKSVIVSVADNGIGIPDELKPHFFERKESAMIAGLNGNDSGGLGMSIIKSIVEMHGGMVWFESEVGKGSTFYIELPKE